jgi:RNA-directed DNA polymerase
MVAIGIVIKKARALILLGMILLGTCTKSRHGGYLVGRGTIAKRFAKKVKELSLWFKSMRNMLVLKELWKILAAKLQGHYQYYGISGNYRGIHRYYRCAIRLAFKWLNRRSQRKSFNWQQFTQYLEKYPLPKLYIAHRLY